MQFLIIETITHGCVGMVHKHFVKHTNPFHVIDFVTNGHGFIVVMCPRQGLGKGPQKGNCCENVKQWC